MGRENDVIDLDTLLDLRDEPGDERTDLEQDESTGQKGMPNTDKLTVVGIFLDDSGSMQNKVNEVIAGLRLSVDSLKKAKGSDFYLDVQGFLQTYYKGFLRDLEFGVFDAYRAGFDSTPIVAKTMKQRGDLISVADHYRQMGIPTSIAHLIITDGLPESDTREPSAFRERLESVNYVVGMGIAPKNDEYSIAKFNELFNAMGIRKIMTPNSEGSEIRHAMNSFSQSVAAIAS